MTDTCEELKGKCGSECSEGGGDIVPKFILRNTTDCPPTPAGPCCFTPPDKTPAD